MSSVHSHYPHHTHTSSQHTSLQHKKIRYTPFHSNIEYPQKDLAFERNIFPLLFIVIRIAGEKRKKAGWVSCGLAAGLLLLGQRVKKSINSHSSVRSR
jgi:hypothetical protein